MNAVLKGGDRQELHEKIRVYSMEAGKQVKELGLPIRVVMNTVTPLCDSTVANSIIREISF